MAAFNAAAKLYCVGRLACYDSPSDVVKGLKEELGIDARRSQVQAYDPTTAQGSRLSKDLADIFHETRKKFLEDTTSIPIANKAVRLRMLQRSVDAAASRGNHSLMASLLEQAAKEVGDSFTNRQKLEQSGVVGHANIPAPKNPAPGTTPEDAYKAMLGGAR